MRCLSPKSLLLFISLVVLFYVLSYWLLMQYTFGDQEHYWRLYRALSSANFFDVTPLAQTYVSGREPVYAYALWLGAKLGLDKNVYISFYNVLLLLGVCLLLRRHRVPWFIYCLLLTNFYLVVLLTGAERLKFAYIFFVYAALLSGAKSSFMLALSPFAHLSSFIPIIALGFPRLVDFIAAFLRRGVFRAGAFISLFVSILLVIAAFVLLQEAVVNKAGIYLRKHGGAPELLNMLLLLIIGLVAAKKKCQLFLTMMPFFGFAFLLGAMRVNMLAVTLFVYLLLLENRIQHPLVVLLLFYLSMKSIPFIHNIIAYGSGFAGPLV